MSKQFKPLLASEAEWDKLRYPLIASPKLDGIRCLIINGVAVSRTLKPIRNKTVQAWVKANAAVLEGLDGELVSGPHDAEVFNRTTSVVMSEDGGEEWTYHVFDLWNLGHPYRARLQLLLSTAIGLKYKVKMVPAKLCRTETDLKRFEQECIKRGYEGAMVRDPNGVYKQGRSTVKEGILLKIKRFSDAEGTIIACNERMHNNNPEERDALGHIDRSTNASGLVPAGDLGAVCVRLANGLKLDIGTGFTSAQRIDLWKQRDKLIGKLVKFKYQSSGMKDLPRFPVFLGFRDPEDV